MFLHIDCNTFFASCEVATDPTLKGRPVVVSNDNDVGGGVILALTPEAKALGLKRGVPLFKVRKQLERDGVVVCQADHKKYHRISQQVMNAVQKQDIVLDFVQYSVDEFFGVLPLDNPDELEYYTRKVMDNITSSTGIPVGCGCSTTYTLAKVATGFAKRYPAYHGVCVLPPEKREKALALVPVGDVWGVGRKLRPQLMQLGIETARDWANRSEEEMSHVLSTPALRTYHELRGVPSITLHTKERQKSIMQSHTFGRMVEDKEALRGHLLRFAERCCISLRAQKSLCSHIDIFLSTNRYRDDMPQYRNGHGCHLTESTADTPTVLNVVAALFDEVYRPGFAYKQAGVILSGIVADEGRQLDLFTVGTDERHRRLMAVADRLNHKFGENTVHFTS